MRQPLRLVALILMAIGFVAPAQAARGTVSPYIEVQQVLYAALNGGGDVLTYTSVAAGIDASASTKRIQAQISYRYEHRFSWDDRAGDEDIHTGVARLDYHLSRAWTLEAGAIAARARTDGRGGLPLFVTGDERNVSEIYGVYAGPSFASTIGALNVNANYRLGYVHVDNGLGSISLGAGQPVLDSYSSSVSHTVDASVGMGVGELPFAWTISAGYVRENVNRLRAHYDGKFVRGDVTLPVSHTVAVTAGVGYEDIQSSQADILRGPDGSPILTPRGRFIADRNAPRLLAYDQDGLIYDAGIIWRPSHRTSLEVHAGKRYGETVVTAQLDYRISEVAGFQAGVYNSVESFGRLLTRRLASMPTSFRSPINPLIGNLDNCVFGTTAGTGGCFDALQSVTTSNFRNRGAYAMFSGGRGRWSYNVGAGYSQRKYLAPSNATFFSLAGVKDESFVAQANLSRDLSANASIDGALYANWYDSGIADTAATTSVGGTITYNKTFTNRLSGQVAAGLYTTEQDEAESATVGSLLVGLRYQF